MISVTKTYLPPAAKYHAYIDRIYKNAWITNNGELVRELEAKLCRYLGVKHLILVANGSLALQVAYRALNLTGEVITTPFSFVATTSTLLWERLKPVFSDINPETYNLAPELIEPKITAHTSAILPVHVYGNPCETNRIDAIAKKNNLKVIYDGAHAFGVKHNGSSVLNAGDASILSFHATKLFHTIEGGAIITDSDETANRVRLLINFGFTGPSTIESIGTNAKMNEFQAAMGLAILDDVDTIIEQRKDIWQKYEQGLGSLVHIQQYSESSTRNYAYAPILLDSPEQRQDAEEALRSANISPRRYFYPSLNTLDYLESTSSCPVSENIAERILCLPLYPNLAADIDIEKIVKLVKAGIGRSTKTMTHCSHLTKQG